LLEPSCIFRWKVVYSSRIELLPCMVRQKYVPATCETSSQIAWNNDLGNDNAQWPNVIPGNERSSEITVLTLLIPRQYPSWGWTVERISCPIHVSKKCQDFFKISGINVFDWPPYSPSLNTIENIWAFISKDVYSKGPIKNLKHLAVKIKATLTSLNKTKSADVSNLYNSITTRLCLMLEKRGQRLKH